MFSESRNSAAKVPGYMLKISPTKPEIESIQKPEIVFVEIGKYFLIFKKNLKCWNGFANQKLLEVYKTCIKTKTIKTSHSIHVWYAFLHLPLKKSTIHVFISKYHIWMLWALYQPSISKKFIQGTFLWRFASLTLLTVICIA